MLALAVCAAGCGGKVERDPSEGVRIVDWGLYMGCMPPAYGDTTWATVSVEYSNQSDVDRSWEIATARFDFLGPMEGTLSFPVEPGGSGLVAPGERRVVTHVKKYGTGVGILGDLCDYCIGGKETWELHLQWFAPSGLIERKVGPEYVGCAS